MAVTSSVFDEVAVAFCCPEVVVVKTMPGRPLEKSGEYVLAKVLEASVMISVALLSVGVFRNEEEDCAIIGIVSKAKWKRKNA
jgi:hypothetical protein